jgi:hypothetical protein
MRLHGFQSRIAQIEPRADRPQSVMLGADKGHTCDFVFELPEKAVSRK